MPAPGVSELQRLDDPARTPPHVIAIADGEIPSVELCVVAPLDRMQAQGWLTYELFYERRLPCAVAWRRADLLLGMRCVRSATVRLAGAVRAAGIPFIYMVDDDFESVPADHWLARHYRSYGTSRNLRDLVSLADYVITFSQVLAARLRGAAGQMIVAPTISGLPEVDGQAPLERPPAERHEVRVGFAGSPTHERDVDIVGDVLAQILERRPEVVVESIGQCWNGLVGHPRYRHFDQVQGLDAFARFLRARNWDIGLAPMEITPFNCAKTDNKYRTYSAVGLPAVYTRIPSLAEVVRDGETGLLVENDVAAWTAALETLVGDPQLRTAMGRAALDDHRARYGLGRVVDCYRDCFSRALSKLRLLCLGGEHASAGTSCCPSLAAALRDDPILLPRFRGFDDVATEDVAWAQVVLLDTDDPDELEAARQHYEPLGRPAIAFMQADLFDIPAGFVELRRRFEGEHADRLESALSRVDRVVVAGPAPSSRLQRLSAIAFGDGAALRGEIVGLAGRSR